MKADLIKTITKDCEYWENLGGNGFCNYLFLNECKDSCQNGMYQLILNGEELWYGTLEEINAVVKTMILREEKEY